MLKLKLQYFGHLISKNWLIAKNLDAGKDRRQEKGTTENGMVGWHHWLDGHEFEQNMGVGNVQGGLECCGPWGHKKLDMTEQLNWLTNIETTQSGLHWHWVIIASVSFLSIELGNTSFWKTSQVHTDISDSDLIFNITECYFS